MPESPKWLLSRGKIEEVHKVLKSINKDAPEPEEIKEIGQGKVAQVTLAKEHKIGQVMKHKSSLRNSQQYKKVYIEPKKSILEQKQEATLRALARATKGVTFRRGQIVEEKKEEAGQEPMDVNHTGAPNEEKGKQE